MTVEEFMNDLEKVQPKSDLEIAVFLRHAHSMEDYRDKIKCVNAVTKYTKPDDVKPDFLGKFVSTDTDSCYVQYINKDSLKRIDDDKFYSEGNGSKIKMCREIALLIDNIKDFTDVCSYYDLTNQTHLNTVIFITRMIDKFELAYQCLHWLTIVSNHLENSDSELEPNDSYIMYRNDNIIRP